MPTGPQLGCSLVQNSMQNQTPLLWHQSYIRFTYDAPHGNMVKMSGRNQGIKVCSLFTACSCKIRVKVGKGPYPWYTGSTPRMAYPTAGYPQPSSKRLLTNYSWNTASGLPYTYLPICYNFFPKHITHMKTVITCCKVAFIKVS